MSGALDPDVARDLERFEARVWSDAVSAASPETAARLGLAARPVADGIALVASNLPSLLYNRYFGFGLEAPIDEAAIDQAIALYPQEGPFSIQPSPLARPPGIAERLRARGIESYFNWVIWARDARAPLVAPEVRIECIDSDRATTWVELATTIFTDESSIGEWLRALIGRAGWSHYLAFEGERAVGVGALFAEGPLGWIGWGGTLSEFRRRGIQRAMIARRVCDAAERGALWVRSETADDLPDKPNASFRNMAHSGFVLAYRRPSHVRFPR
jgi:hypothetical protein